MINEVENQVAEVNEIMSKDNALNMSGEVEMGNGDKIIYIFKRVKKENKSQGDENE